MKRDPSPGALTRRIGKFEQCNGGTIFLDEIGDMTPATQAKVLRVLQDRQFERLGGSERITVDVRLIVATNKDLEKAIREGTFRQDLYYRLKVVSLHLPPLRERKEDIPELVRYFLQRFWADINREVQRHLSPGAGKTHALPLAGKRTGVGEFSQKGPGDHQREHPSPGRFSPGRDGVRGGADRAPGFGRASPEADGTGVQGIGGIIPTEPGVGPDVRVGKDPDQRALQETRGNQVQAAILLGISRNTLRSKIERYRIKKDVAIVEENE